MTQAAMIVSIITLLGWLFLVLRNSEIRSLDRSRVLKLAAVWAAIIVTMLVVVQMLGLSRP
ncbi:hypothetical protein [Novosphingobium panipatense]|uniref:Twin transmembrane helix small protein n=1 Tax=Novosphingobium panipatense TaxID=428991 RepID=A0ABY1Q2R1_9SPHN|nr:hypothetical protein [Novosphingobium panipatense]SMP57428.1 hypothetical protein SAMN06296065_102275 [Novosphingobium panipatense]